MKKLTRKSLDELAKLVQVLDETEQMEFVGCGNGTSNSPYTQAEYNSMSVWNGGYVEGWGYVNKEIVVYGNSDYPSGTSQTYYNSLSDYLLSLSSSGANQVAGAVISELPIVGSYTGYLAQEYGDMTRDMQAELLRLGYDNSSSFIVVKTEMKDGIMFSVYNTETGELVTSRTINSYGNWK